MEAEGPGRKGWEHKPGALGTQLPWAPSLLPGCAGSRAGLPQGSQNYSLTLCPPALEPNETHSPAPSSGPMSARPLYFQLGQKPRAPSEKTLSQALPHPLRCKPSDLPLGLQRAWLARLGLAQGREQEPQGAAGAPIRCAHGHVSFTSSSVRSGPERPLLPDARRVGRRSTHSLLECFPKK